MEPTEYRALEHADGWTVELVCRRDSRSIGTVCRGCLESTARRIALCLNKLEPWENDWIERNEWTPVASVASSD